MKNFFKSTVAIVLGMALILAFQYLPFQEIFSAKAQTVRMLAGPLSNPLDSSYLTPTSSTINSTLPPYALPRVNIWEDTGSGYLPKKPIAIDVNADGLLDQVYSYVYVNTSGPEINVEQYTILNTGSGFNLAYVCTYKLQSGVHTYKGDCAHT